MPFLANFSPLARQRADAPIALPAILRDLNSVVAQPGAMIPTERRLVQQLVQQFPKTIEQPLVHFSHGAASVRRQQLLKIGVVLSGGQAPGGHNVIAGLFDAMKQLHPDSRLLGFCDGPNGILTNQTIEITEELLASFRNQGGFDLLGSGRTKISTAEQFAAAMKTAEELGLNGLVIVGGDDSNTNAALLAEYFLAEGCTTRVVGVPKTIDGDVKNALIEISFGFDSAAKCYSETIGNIARDAVSAKKYYYFIRIMGRSASHLALECALQCHPNLTLISEEVAAKKMSLNDVVNELCDMVVARAADGKQYGVVLIPEGIIEFIPEVKELIAELNQILAGGDGVGVGVVQPGSFSDDIEGVKDKLSEGARGCFSLLPQAIQQQLLADRDPHGNVQVSKIETERLLIAMVEQQLQQRRQAGGYFGKFVGQSHFCGYEGRSCLPSYFDCHYCYALGHVAALLVAHGYTGYMSCVKQLEKPVEQWNIEGVPLVNMLGLEQRKGKMVPVITKALVDLDGEPFGVFAKERGSWLVEDDYLCPGPTQFFGPKELVEAVTQTLQLEAAALAAPAVK